MGPGSLYTSVIPNLLIPEIARAVSRSKAPRVYIANLMMNRWTSVRLPSTRITDAEGKDMQGAMSKLFSSQVAERVTSISLELFGGYGYTTDYPAEKFYRDAKIGAIYEGTSNMQLQTIAKGMLR